MFLQKLKRFSAKRAIRKISRNNYLNHRRVNRAISKIYSRNYFKPVRFKLFHQKCRIYLHLKAMHRLNNYYRVRYPSSTQLLHLITTKHKLKLNGIHLTRVYSHKKLNQWLIKQIFKDQLNKFNFAQLTIQTLNLIAMFSYILKLCLILNYRYIDVNLSNKLGYLKIIHNINPKARKLLRRQKKDKIPFKVVDWIPYFESHDWYFRKHRVLGILVSWLAHRKSKMAYDVLKTRPRVYSFTRTFIRLLLLPFILKPFQRAYGKLLQRTHIKFGRQKLLKYSFQAKLWTKMVKLVYRSKKATNKFTQPLVGVKTKLRLQRTERFIKKFLKLKNLHYNFNPFKQYNFVVLKYQALHRRLVNIKTGKYKIKIKKEKRLQRKFLKLKNFICLGRKGLLNTNKSSNLLGERSLIKVTEIYNLNKVIRQTTKYTQYRKLQLQRLILLSFKSSFRVGFYKYKKRERNTSFLFKRHNYNGFVPGFLGSRINYFRTFYYRNDPLTSVTAKYHRKKIQAIRQFPGIVPNGLRFIRSYFKKRIRKYYRRTWSKVRRKYHRKYRVKYFRLRYKKKLILKYIRFKLKMYLRKKLTKQSRLRLRWRRVLKFILYCNKHKFVIKRFYLLLKVFKHQKKLKFLKKTARKTIPKIKFLRRIVNKIIKNKTQRFQFSRLPGFIALNYKIRKLSRRGRRWQRNNWVWRCRRQRNFYKLRRLSPGFTFTLKYGKNLGAYWRKKQLSLYRIKQLHIRKSYNHVQYKKKILKLFSYKFKKQFTLRHLRHYKFRNKRHHRRAKYKPRRRRLFRKFFSLDRKILKIYKNKMDKIFYKRMPYRLKIPKIKYYWPKQSKYQFLFKNQLRAQQRFRWLFRLRYDQIIKIYKKVIFYTKRRFEYKFLKYLELRIDTVIYRLNFAFSLAQARLLVRKHYFVVNEKLVSWPKYQINIGDIIIPRFQVRLRRHPEYFWTFDHGYFYNSTRLFWRPIQLDNYTDHFIINERVPVAIIIQNPNPFTVYHIKQFSLQQLTCSFLKYS